MCIISINRNKRIHKEEVLFELISNVMNPLMSLIRSIPAAACETYEFDKRL